MFYTLKATQREIVGAVKGGTQLTIFNEMLSEEFSEQNCLPRQVEKRIDVCKGISPLITTSKKTKITDFCDCGFTTPFQYIVSPKVVKLLKSFVVSPYKFLPVPVYEQDKNIHFYQLLNLYGTLPDKYIDYERTVFAIYDKKGVEVDAVVGKNTALEQNISLRRVKRYAFNDKLTLPDIFMTPGRLVLFLSDRLTHAITENKITGLNIYEYTEDSDLGVNSIRKSSKRIY